MEEKIIEQITDEKIIREILTCFTPYLRSLRAGKVEKDALAQKYAKYGIVLRLVSDKHSVAFASFYCNDVVSKIGYLSMIAVLPEYERHGYGSLLMHKIFDIMHTHGMLKLRLEVNKNNAGAIRFYEKLGFKPIEKESADSAYMEIVLTDD